MNPGSSYYQEITANTYVDDDENNQDSVDQENNNKGAKAGKKADKKAGKANQQVAANTSQEEQNAAHLSRLSGKEGVASNPQLRNRQAHQERLAEMEARTEQMRQAALERIKKLEAEK